MDINLVRLPISLFHLVTLSLCLPVTFSPCHLLTLLNLPTFRKHHFSFGGMGGDTMDINTADLHPFTLSHLHLFTLSPSHLVTFSPCSPFRPSRSTMFLGEHTMDIDLVQLPIFTLSHCHLFTLSPCRLFTLPPSQLFQTGELLNTFFFFVLFLLLRGGDAMDMNLVRQPIVNLSPCHLLTLSPCHISPSHPG